VGVAVRRSLTAGTGRGDASESGLVRFGA
jgi:hypothetical protein